MTSFKRVPLWLNPLFDPWAYDGRVGMATPPMKLICGLYCGSLALDTD
ncbi:hypothetical protein OAJ78_02575 [Gammaproteobacteria bacterium]|nr:hypothetical protein [Gammaproteobacteria bacterium]